MLSSDQFPSARMEEDVVEGTKQLQLQPDWQVEMQPTEAEAGVVEAMAAVRVG